MFSQDISLKQEDHLLLLAVTVDDLLLQVINGLTARIFTTVPDSQDQ
ncbi:MAG: hypothetical protein OEL83_17890 [Desulforhopalus sp.]|nr:hypothetical protein [Desulforhopalus sp.]